jgi:hypothetical protein
MVTRRSKLVPTGVPAVKGPKSFLTKTVTESDPLGSEKAVPAGNGRVATFEAVKIAFCMVTRLRPDSAPLVTSSSKRIWNEMLNEPDGFVVTVPAVKVL